MRLAVRALTISFAASVAAAAQAAIPTEIVLPGKYGRMGDVRFPHRLHFGVGARCATCHGPGPAGRIEAVHDKMKTAHEFCIGCHRKEARGPSDQCAACHGPRKDAAPRESAER
jgi:mono/diheme cytochrome c family protein